MNTPHLLRRLLAVVVLCAAVLAGMVAWPTQSPPPLASLADAARRIDTAGMPPLDTFSARDGTALAWRRHAPAQAQTQRAATVALLVHGSSADSRNMNGVGKALAQAGFEAYSLDVRGHGASGRRGDIDHVGQLDEDLADAVAELKRRHPGASLTMVGFSSGGGFTLRTAGGASGELFDRYVMVAPLLHQNAPTARADSGGWVKVNMPRIVALTILDRIGVHAFEHLPVLAFALPPEAAAAGRTTMYSYRLQLSFRPREDYLDDVRAIRRPATVIVAANDELFRAEAYAPLLEPIQPLLKVKMLPALRHIDLVVDPAALREIVAAAS